MFKRGLVIVLAVFFLCAGAVYAQEEASTESFVNYINLVDIIKKIPDLKAGVGYSFVDNDVKDLYTTEIIAKDGFALEGGYTNSFAIIAGSYKLLKLADYIDLPILDLIEANIGLYGGINADLEGDYGASATFLNVKFD